MMQLPYPFCNVSPAYQKDKIFGAENGKPPYRLRQARYCELGKDLAAYAYRHHQQTGQPLKLLDCGVDYGALQMHTQLNAGSEYIEYNAADLPPHISKRVYKAEHYHRYYSIDLNHGLPAIPDNEFDVVVCEQVLEHLENVPLAMTELSRIVKSGGVLVFGIPIFPEGLHWIRKYIVPRTDKLGFKLKKKRGHIQAWSKRTFLNDFRRSCPDLMIEQVRGFRIVSGGVLRPLEYCRWWWAWNRFIGGLLPSLCTEIQVIARK